MSQFKAGDRVKIVRRFPNNFSGLQDWNKPNGDVGKVGIIKDMISGQFSVDDFYNPGQGYLGIFSTDEIAPIESHNQIAEPKFILQYMKKEDPFEFFATEKELTARVSELVKDSSVRQDSYRWYEIARQGTVELQPKMLGLYTKTKLVETVKQSSGRKRRTFKTCEACGKIFNRLGTHQKAAHPELTR